MKKNFFDLNIQLSLVDEDIKKYYHIINLNSKNPLDIAKARIIGEERHINIELSSEQKKISENYYQEFRVQRRIEEKKVYLAGGESLPSKPNNNRTPIRRRQTKDLWCFATTALMFAEDSKLITDTHRHNICTHKPVLYESNPKLRYKYCGYDAKLDRYYCDPGQEYTVMLCGDTPESCNPGNVQDAAQLLIENKMYKIGNNNNSFWLNKDGTLDLEKQKTLSEKLTVPAICDGFLEGESKTGKGHSFLIKNFFYNENKVILYMEESVYGEKPILDNFSKYIDCSVFEFRIKITNIYIPTFGK